MTDIVGLLPMGGEGKRLGLPFPKPLAPTITHDGIVPLYRHALDEIDPFVGRVYAIVQVGTDRCLTTELIGNGIFNIQTTEPLLTGALRTAGRWITREHGPDTLVVTGLPDSIWTMAPGRDIGTMLDAVRGDGALGLFTAAADELDDVVVDTDKVIEVVTKTSENPYGLVVQGWGAFAIRAEMLAMFDDERKDGPQLGSLDMGWAWLGHSVDLGTPERYIRWHDTRKD